MSAKIVMTRDYLMLKTGDIVALSNNVNPKKNSVEVIHRGNTFDVPVTFCRPEIANIMGKPVSLSDLLGDDEAIMTGMLGDDEDIMTGIPTPPAAPVKVRLKDNQVHMSFFTGGALPKSNIDHVINMYPSDTWAEEHWNNIPEIDEFYVWNPAALECLILGLDDNEHVLFTGMPGTGKTTAHQQFAAIIGQPFYAVNGKDGMEPSSYLGSVAPDGLGGWKWQDGALPTCMLNGYYLCIDEVFKIPAGIQMTMQTVWQRGGSLVLDDKPGNLADKLVKPDPKFRLMASDNVKGLGDDFAKFSGTQLQDTSTLDRFDTTYSMPYLPEDQEIYMLNDMFPKVDDDIIMKLVQIANLIRNGYKAEELSLTLSPRGLTSMCRKILRGLHPEEAFKYAYLSKLADETEINAVKEFLKTCGLVDSFKNNKMWL